MAPIAAAAAPSDAWFCGAFDSEGCICIQSSHPVNEGRPLTDAGITLTVKQCDNGTITALFCARFGGSTRAHATTAYNGRPEWVWRLSARNVVLVAARVLLAGSRSPWKRLFLKLALQISVLPPGLMRAATASHFRRLKALEHQGRPVEESDDDDLVDPGRLPSATLPWLAGFNDGDGSCVCMSGGNVRLDVTQAEPHALCVLQPFVDFFGVGHIWWYSPKNPNWMRRARWQLDRQADVVAVARLLLPESHHPDRRAHLALVIEMLTVPPRPLSETTAATAAETPGERRHNRVLHRRAVWAKLRQAKNLIRARSGLAPRS